MYRILMVEDDIDLCQGWSEIFSLLGHSLKCHHRGQSLIEDVDGIATYDLLITDYYLPDMNGAEVIRRVRKLNPRLPVVLLTGSRETAIIEEASKLSDVRILHKPATIDQLMSEIVTILSAPPSDRAGALSALGA